MLRSKSLSFLLTIALPLALVAVPAVAPATALAMPTENAPAPPPRTTVTASFQRYLLSPNGRTMGLMLSDGTFVHTPGRALHHDAPALQTGDKLEIEGVALKTPTGVIIRRAVVKAHGDVIADASAGHHRHAHRGQGGQGPGAGQGGQGQPREHHGKHHHDLTPVVGNGQIAAMVSTPTGHVLALVLTDGTTASAHHLEALGLKIGDKVSVAGQGGVYPRGKALRIEKITLPNGQTRDIPRPVRVHQAPSQTPV